MSFASQSLELKQEQPENRNLSLWQLLMTCLQSLKGIWMRVQRFVECKQDHCSELFVRELINTDFTIQPTSKQNDTIKNELLD